MSEILKNICSYVDPVIEQNHGLVNTVLIGLKKNPFPFVSHAIGLIQKIINISHSDALGGSILFGLNTKSRSLRNSRTTSKN